MKGRTCEHSRDKIVPMIDRSFLFMLYMYMVPINSELIRRQFVNIFLSEKIKTEKRFLASSGGDIYCLFSPASWAVTMPVGVTGKQLAHKYMMSSSEGKLRMFSRISNMQVYHPRKGANI